MSSLNSNPILQNYLIENAVNSAIKRPRCAPFLIIHFAHLLSPFRYVDRYHSIPLAIIRHGASTTHRKEGTPTRRLTANRTSCVRCHPLFAPTKRNIVTALPAIYRNITVQLIYFRRGSCNRSMLAPKAVANLVQPNSAY